MTKNIKKNSLFDIKYTNNVGKDAYFVKNHIDIFFNNLASFSKQQFSLSLKIKKIEIEILLVQSDTIKEINKEFREKDKSTNILSFQTYSRLELRELDEESCYLGSIIICFDKLLEESKQITVSKVDYLYILLAHGFLHLLGFNHSNEEEALIMHTNEEMILRSLKLSSKPLIANYFKNKENV